jgi:hypothetical protein
LQVLLVTAALCPFIFGQKQSGKPFVDAKTVSAEIDSQGPAIVLKKFTSGSGRQWKTVLHGIESGSPAWLEVAAKLLTASDAGHTTDLYFSLAMALTRNAAGVLAMVGPNLPIKQVCSVPYIEPDAETIAKHRKKARAALEKVNSTDLASQKAACLAALEH